MELGIKGKRAVVTGAGQGIGRETALVLAQEGAVVCVSDINDSRGKETVEEICERGGTGIYIHADVGVPEEIKHLFRTAAERLGSVDILMCCLDRLRLRLRYESIRYSDYLCRRYCRTGDPDHCHAGHYQVR